MQTAVSRKVSSYHVPILFGPDQSNQLFCHWHFCLKYREKKASAKRSPGIEVKRSTKEIGSSLEADIDVYLGEEYLKIAKDINLPEYFITSKAQAKKMTTDDKIFKLEEISDVGVLVRKAKGEKCSRCWKILGNPCERCRDVLKN